MTEEQEKLIGREFRHFKGGDYRIEGFAKDSETLEEMVVYRALYGERGLWVLEFYGGRWMKEPGKVITCCNDGLRTISPCHI